MKNEKGYTLILVMIIITVTMILGLALSGATLNERTQVNKTDNRNKATDLAEMGVTYYQSFVTKKITEAKQNAKDYRDHYNDNLIISHQLNEAQLDQLYDPFFIDQLSTLLTINPDPVLVETEKNKFVITFLKLYKSNLNNLVVNFESSGTSETESATVTGSFTIKKNSQTSKVNQPKPTSDSFSETETSPVNLVNQPKFKTKDHSTYFNDYVNIQGNRILTVNGDAYFIKLNLQGSAKVKIVGDAIFETDITTTGNAYSICVTGNTYKLDSTKTKLIDYPISRNTCSNTSGTIDWALDVNNGIQVKY